MDRPTPEDEARDNWWRRMAKSLHAPLKETYEKDWMDSANCLDNDQFITHPTKLKYARLALVSMRACCRQCPVSQNCLEWADKYQPTGVFIAGEWRE